MPENWLTEKKGTSIMRGGEFGQDVIWEERHDS